MLHLACVHPEIPQNVGTLIRTAACLNFHVHLVEPLGFLMCDKYLKRAHMDYVAQAHVTVHTSFDAFCAAMHKHRLLALSPKGEVPFVDFVFKDGDCLVLGCESKGLSKDHQSCMHMALRIPMHQGRSLNMAIAGSIVMSHALFLQNK